MAMSQEDHDSSAGPGRPLSTGEFRAVPDSSASTAQFRAFAESGGERPAGRNVTRLTALVVAAAVILAILVLLVVR